MKLSKKVYTGQQVLAIIAQYQAEFVADIETSTIRVSYNEDYAQLNVVPLGPGSKNDSLRENEGEDGLLWSIDEFLHEYDEEEIFRLVPKTLKQRRRPIELRSDETQAIHDHQDETDPFILHEWFDAKDTEEVEVFLW